MTVIIGMYYDDKNGALIASDSRRNWGSYYDLVKKVDEVERVIIATSGTICVSNELKENLKKDLKTTKRTKDIKKIVKKNLKKLVGSKNEMDLEGIFGFYENRPEIFCFYEDGDIELIDDFDTKGCGWTEVHKILKNNYRSNISKKEGIELAIYSILESSKDNKEVDDNPQICLIENKKYKIINYDRNGNFNFYKSKILKVKNRIIRISEQYQTAFDILWRGDKKTKNKLIKILNDYKN